MQKIGTVAYYTFREILKSKILINIFFVGLGLIFLTYIATEFTYGVPERVTLDFGLGMLSLSSLAISLFLGVTLLSKEIDSRTVYMVISRPVPRYAFILGKIIGLMSIQFVNVLILSSMTLIATVMLGGDLTPLVFWAISFIFIESLVLLLVVILASLFMNTVLSVIVSFSILFLGYSVKETQNISFVASNKFLHNLLDIYQFILPAFYKWNLKDFILYKTHLPLSYLIPNMVYGMGYSIFLLILIIMIFNHKNLD